MFSIGEFSKSTGLTVKALRFYHEQGLLIPASIDDQTGYRYYSVQQIEAARIIVHLRSLEFPLEQIRALLARNETEWDAVLVLQEQRARLAEQARHYQRMVKSLDLLIRREQKSRMAAETSSFEVEEKAVPAQIIAGIRMRGRYSDCGKAFGRIGRASGRHICGPCFLLHYDSEYQEDDANFEACMPVRKTLRADGITVRELPGGRCVSLMHRGPYDDLGRSYARVLQYLKSQGDEPLLPTREIYLKGPGMIFRGNPQEYLTEIQLFFAAQEAITR